MLSNSKSRYFFFYNGTFCIHVSVYEQTVQMSRDCYLNSFSNHFCVPLMADLWKLIKVVLRLELHSSTNARWIFNRHQYS